MDMYIMHLCVYVLGTSLVLDLRYYKPINLLIFQPAPSLLLCAVSPGFMNLKEIEIESQICLAAFVGCKKQTHKYKTVDFPYVNFSLSQAMAAQAWHELWRHIKCVCVSLSCLWDIWCALKVKVPLVVSQNFSAAAPPGKHGTGSPAVWEGDIRLSGPQTVEGQEHHSPGICSHQAPICSQRQLACPAPCKLLPASTRQEGHHKQWSCMLQGFSHGLRISLQQCEY